MAFTPSSGFTSRTTANVTGHEDVLRSMQRLGKAGREAGRRVLVAKAQQIVDEAKPLTPDDPETQGALRDSVRLSQSRVSTTRGNITVSVIAGGAPLEAHLGKRKVNASAVIQHEDLTLHHTSGGPKFIEKPFLKIAPTVPDALLEEIDREEARG